MELEQGLLEEEQIHLENRAGGIVDRIIEVQKKRAEIQATDESNNQVVPASD